ncbi:hypothetical protein E4U42_000702 [Claviceps africana]|uniref:Defects in morphology protein 1 n=1 Tax=Claviceps africana TaxID=83212 RepID=A0A8K0NKE5_9HYPO|nr:hypothetical protein E4U42_000702 [Claviceps africana]
MAVHEILDNESNYGSDFSPEDEQLLMELVSGASQACLSTTVVDVLAAPNSDVACPDGKSGPADTFSHDGDSNAAGKHVCHRLQTAQVVDCDSSSSCPESIIDVPPSTDVTYPDLSRALTELARSQKRGRRSKSVGKVAYSGDDRSPLQRFRSFPQRPLSVSDLTAGAWCELQYWYTLTRLPGGRRTKTAAMKQGSKVHEKLEKEVYTTVEIDVLTKEDGFAMRLWNFIHGLRTLREIGLTRELEVWGVVDGNFVNGVIDSVSHQNPNPDFEKELVRQSQRESNQKSLTDFFEPGVASTGTAASNEVYLTDVKTRGSLTPIKKPSLRPAKIQLMLYHRFLSQIAAGELDFLGLFHRYGLDADKTFSDIFLAQLGDMHEEVFRDSWISDSDTNGADGYSNGEDAAAEDSTNSGQLKYQNLRELTCLVKEEVGRTFPRGQASMGQMLRVQYLHRDDGREIDVHDFPVSGPVLDEYLKGYMSWWQGEREAMGVEIEEAYKCRTCEFADECSWRNAKVEERMQNARETVMARRKKSASTAS